MIIFQLSLFLPLPPSILCIQADLVQPLSFLLTTHDSPSQHPLAPNSDQQNPSPLTKISSSTQRSVYRASGRCRRDRYLNGDSIEPFRDSLLPDEGLEDATVVHGVVGCTRVEVEGRVLQHHSDGGDDCLTESGKSDEILASTS